MIIVTGGAGFVGSNIVAGLNGLGRSDILIVDNLTNARKHLNLNRLDFADYLDKEDFINSLQKFSATDIDVIFHQGACSDTTQSDGRYMMKNNYEYSKQLFNFASENKIRFIYASSASVYGNGLNGFKEELACEYPINVYAYSKFLFDQYVRKHITQCQHQVVGLRYFNVYGEQEDHKGRMASVANHFFNQRKTNGVIKLFEGSDHFVRDFVYVKDVVDVNLFFYANPQLKGIYNCGSGQAESFYEIAKITQSVYPDVQLDYIPFPQDLKGKYQEYTCADISALRQAGYDRQMTSLQQGIREYYAYLEKI